MPCVAAPPRIIPYTPPSAFEERFRAAHPVLHERLARTPVPQGHRLGGGRALDVAAVDRALGHWRRERLRLSEAR